MAREEALLSPLAKEVQVSEMTYLMSTKILADFTPTTSPTPSPAPAMPLPTPHSPRVPLKTLQRGTSRNGCSQKEIEDTFLFLLVTW